MSRVSYVNGRFFPHKQVNVHVEDRGYQFADGVYEVILVKNRLLVDEIPHLDRLERSLEALEIPSPMKRQALKMVIKEVVAKNKFKDGIVYIQITRGVARRDHGFPKFSKPTLVITARSLKMPGNIAEKKGAKATDGYPYLIGHPTDCAVFLGTTLGGKVVVQVVIQFNPVEPRVLGRRNE